MNLRMTPVDLNKQTMEPTDPRLHAALQAYAERELGGKLSVPYYARLWAIEATKEDDPEYSEIMGIAAIRQTFDCQIFHITPPTQDKAGLQLAEQARDLAVYRLHSYLQDIGLRGGIVLIYVSETAQRYWRRFLGRIGVKAANRFEMNI